MKRDPHPRRNALCWGAVLAVAAVFLAGCSLVNRGPFEVTLPAANGLRPLPIRLFDHSNTITNLEVPVVNHEPPAGAADKVAIAAPGRPNAVFVVWLGGMCDEQVDLEYTGGDATFTVTAGRSAGGCRLAGVQRSVIVTFSSPIDASTITVQ